jgi:hypothetical protein
MDRKWAVLTIKMAADIRGVAFGDYCERGLTKRGRRRE